MSAGLPVVVSDAGAFQMKFGKRSIALSPSQGFDLAEELIRGATRRMVREEADRVAILDIVHKAGYCGDRLDR